MSERPSTTRLICPLTADNVADMRRDMFKASEGGADAVECRLDFLVEPPSPSDIAGLLVDAPLEVIVTNRPVRQGGRFKGDESQRLAVLAWAAQLGADLVDVEIDTPRADWPESRIILSHHDFDRTPADLDAIASRLDASDASVNKVVFAAGSCGQALRAFDVIRTCSKPTIALAMGQPGVLTRIVARKFGAFGTFAALSPGAESAPGQPAIEQFKRLYRWDSLSERTNLYGVIGCPVGHSMSPAIHNAAFDALGLDAVYVPLLIEAGWENFHAFADALLARPWLDWRGLSVTIPHKENALAYVGADNCDELAVRIGAINTITISPDGGLRGDNTDYAAAIDALCDAMGIARDGLADRSVAVIGAGGASRAIVAALAHYAADVTIYNRTLSRGQQLAAEFSCRSAGLDAVGKLDAEIVINCTPIGMHPGTDASPLDEIPSGVKVVFDTIYNPTETLLLRLARRGGCRTVSGLDMFVNQAAAQLETWTGESAPRETMRKVVVNHLA